MTPETTPPAPLVAVVLLNWNGWRDTAECLGSLARLRYPSVLPIVVDNASSDGSERILRDAHPEATVIQSGANLGFAGGYNVGIRHALAAGAEYVWVLNNDTVVDEDALDPLVERLRCDPDCGILGSTLLDYRDRTLVQALGGARYNRWLGTARSLGEGSRLGDLGEAEARAAERRLDYVIGASMFVSRAFVEEVGLIDTSYFLFFEELDWVARTPRRYHLGYEPRSLVYHKEGASIGKNRSDDLAFEKRLRYEYFLVRSRLLYTRRFHPACLPTVVAGLGLTLAARLLRGQRTRAAVLWRALAALATGRGAPEVARHLPTGDARPRETR